MVRRTHNQPNHRSHLRPFNSTLEMLGFLFFHLNQAPCYKLYALAPPAVAAPPSKPGVVRVAAGGAAIVLETYDIPLVSVGAFMKKVDSQRRYTLSNLTVGTRIHSLCACCHQVCPEGVCRFAGLEARDTAAPGTLQRSFPNLVVSNVACENCLL